MSRDLRDALDVLEKEKNISKDTLLEAIEQSLIQACKNHFGTSDNIKIVMDRNGSYMHLKVNSQWPPT